MGSGLDESGGRRREPPAGSIQQQQFHRLALCSRVSEADQGISRIRDPSEIPGGPAASVRAPDADCRIRPGLNSVFVDAHLSIPENKGVPIRGIQENLIRVQQG
jgi:hypothetical protein